MRASLSLIFLLGCDFPSVASPPPPSGPGATSSTEPSELSVPTTGTTGALPTTTGDTGGFGPTGIDCTPIAAEPGFELCEESADHCAGVFTDGSGCEDFCAAAGLECVARYGGEPGCQKEPQSPLACGADTGHQSDWCECGLPAAPGSCDTDPTAVTLELGLDDGVYAPRHNWVLECRDYAYTASGAEHEACDPGFNPDGSRTGTATYTFHNVPRGTWDVYVGGRHTENRNPAGALFVVDGHAVVIDQTDPSGDMVWDYHGTWCLEGTVQVVLDSTVNDGSDSVFGARLVPVP